MHKVELSVGPLEYEDTGGEGPVLVFLHGLMIDSSVWRNVVPALQAEYRCVTPTWPLGGHRLPMNPDADLSLRGLALLVDEFLERLDLRDVTLIVNDWGGAQGLISEGRADRVGKLVLTPCEAFDNYPPGIPGRMIVRAMKVPGGLKLAMWMHQFHVMRRGPAAWGWMSKRPVPRAVMDNWFRPALKQPEIRRDMKKYGLSTPSKESLLDWAQRMRSFDRPVLIVWATEDKIMPRDHGRRLAELFPDSLLVEIEDSYTLISEDQPEVFTETLRDFLKETEARD